MIQLDLFATEIILGARKTESRKELPYSIMPFPRSVSIPWRLFQLLGRGRSYGRRRHELFHMIEHGQFQHERGKGIKFVSAIDGKTKLYYKPKLYANASHFAFHGPLASETGYHSWFVQHVGTIEEELEMCQWYLDEWCRTRQGFPKQKEKKKKKTNEITNPIPA